MGSALAAKLREKFKDPRLVLKALGLDESLLAEARAEAIKLAQDSKRRAHDAESVRAGGKAYSFHPSVAEAERRFGDPAEAERIAERGEKTDEGGQCGTGHDDELPRREDGGIALDDEAREALVSLLRDIERVLHMIGAERSEERSSVGDTIPHNGLGKRLAGDNSMAFDARKAISHITVGGLSRTQEEQLMRERTRPALAMSAHDRADMYGRFPGIARILEA